MNFDIAVHAKPWELKNTMMCQIWHVGRLRVNSTALYKALFLTKITLDSKNNLVCMKNGLVLGPCGPRSIRMRPTLVFEKRHAQETLHLLEKVMTEYSSWDDHVTNNHRKIRIWLPKFQPLPKSRRRSACYYRIWKLYLIKITAIKNKNRSIYSWFIR